MRERILRAGARSATSAVVAYFLLTVALTWPLVRGITRDIPADFGDPLLNIWVLAWDCEHLLHALGGHLDALREYWNANIYYPHPLSLAYSEHLTTQAVMVLPVYAVTKNPILCYNVLFLSTFLLSATGMFLFVRELTGSTLAAWLGGLAFGFAPYRFGTLPHLQVLSSMWMPFTLLGFHRFLHTRRSWPLVGGSAAWLAQNLSCGYFLLFFSPVVALYLGLEMTRRRLWSDRTLLAMTALSIVAVGAATSAFLIPYWRLRQLGFAARSLDETIRYSADVLGYFTADVGMAAWGGLIRAWAKPEGSLFPGFTISVLAAVGVLDRWRRARRGLSPAREGPGVRALACLFGAACAVTVAILGGWSLRAQVGGLELRLTSLSRGLLIVAGLGGALLALSPRRRTIAARWSASPVATLALLTIFAFAMSLGPQIRAHGRLVEDQNIYAFFYRLVPGYDGLRVPARCAMIVALGLSALAGFGVSGLPARYRGGATALLTLFIIAESWAAPIPMNINSTEYKQNGLMPLPDTVSAGAELPAVYRFVSTLPPSAALIELPFGEVAFETRFMFYSTTHWRRLVNGYSGGGPDEYGIWAERFKDIASRPDLAWQAVTESGATHIIVHEGSYAGDRGRLVSQWALAHGARELGTFGSDRIFAVR